ncbi:MAG: hypothetical protein U0271_39910 [Polyangiaceae bacterium]
MKLTFVALLLAACGGKAEDHSAASTSAAALSSVTSAAPRLAGTLSAGPAVDACAGCVFIGVGPHNDRAGCVRLKKPDGMLPTSVPSDAEVCAPTCCPSNVKSP